MVSNWLFEANSKESPQAAKRCWLFVAVWCADAPRASNGTLVRWRGQLQPHSTNLTCICALSTAILISFAYRHSCCQPPRKLEFFSRSFACAFEVPQVLNLVCAFWKMLQAKAKCWLGCELSVRRHTIHLYIGSQYLWTCRFNSSGVADFEYTQETTVFDMCGTLVSMQFYASNGQTGGTHARLDIALFHAWIVPKEECF